MTKFQRFIENLQECEELNLSFDNITIQLDHNYLAHTLGCSNVPQLNERTNFKEILKDPKKHLCKYCYEKVQLRTAWQSFGTLKDLGLVLHYLRSVKQLPKDLNQASLEDLLAALKAKPKNMNLDLIKVYHSAKLVNGLNDSFDLEEKLSQVISENHAEEFLNSLDLEPKDENWAVSQLVENLSLRAEKTGLLPKLNKLDKQLNALLEEILEREAGQGKTILIELSHLEKELLPNLDSRIVHTIAEKAATADLWQVPQIFYPFLRANALLETYLVIDQPLNEEELLTLRKVLDMNYQNIDFGYEESLAKAYKSTIALK